MSDEQSGKALRHRASLFAALPGLEAFQALKDEVERKRLRMTEHLMARVMSGTDLPAMQRQVDYDRGFIDGMKYLVDAVPAGAVRKLADQDAVVEEEDPERDLWSYGEEQEQHEQPEQGRDS